MIKTTRFLNVLVEQLWCDHGGVVPERIYLDSVARNQIAIELIVVGMLLLPL